MIALFSSNQGKTAFFISYYPVAAVKDGKDRSEEAINAELTRNLANVRGEIVSRKKLEGLGHPAVEVTAKSPQNLSLLIRCRIICDTNQLYSLTVITSAGEPIQTPEIDSFFSVFKIK